MKEDLMRRISVALDSDEGLASDPALQQELRANPEAQKYAKDLTRVGKWLATWPLPEPDDAAFEALAQRIEQRLDESLSTMSDPTAAPVFDDDDALRDATATLLSSGEFRISDSAIQLIPEENEKAAPPPPPSEAKPVSPIARVTLSKQRVPTIVEESSVEVLSDPRSAELDIATLAAASSTPPVVKKKKKKKSPTSTSGDRISIPTPKPVLGAPTMSPVVQLPKSEERKPAGTLWWFAAAAVVGLGVFGAATLFETQGAPASESARGSTLVTTGTPTIVAAAPAPPPLAPIAAVAPMPTLPPPTVAVAEAVEAAPDMEMERRRAAPMAAPARIATGPYAAATGSAGRTAGDGNSVDDALGAPAHHAARSGVGGSGGGAMGPVGGVTTTPSTTTPSPTPRPAAPAAEAVADLPSTPDRSTIQAVLAARAEAVSACANGAHGLADVDVVISGSGRITTATVNGAFAGTPIGSCIARAVRAATFPPFAQPRFEVTYPYHL